MIVIIIIILLGLIFRKSLRLFYGYQDRKISKERSKIYLLSNNEEFRDVTQQLITNQAIPYDLKQSLIDSERRIAVFKYKSGTETIAGYISYLTHGKHPSMVFLRGGNGYYGIMRPNNIYSFWRNHHVVGTLYRGNLYGGNDEFGGEDVLDVENLIRFFPTLERHTQITLESPTVMVGVSRGAMQMFSSMTQSEYVKSRIQTAISISGNLSLFTSISNRFDMRLMHYTRYLTSNADNFNEWLRQRDPVSNVPKLSKSIKVFLFFGLADERVSIKEQEDMKNALDAGGIENQLITFKDGDHGLSRHLTAIYNKLVN